MSFSIILLAFASMLIVGGLAFSQAASAAPAAASNNSRACEAELSRAGIERMQRQAGAAGREAIACLARAESSSLAAIEPQEKAAPAGTPAQSVAPAPQLGRD
jgi:hypothetical protein